MKSTVTIGLVIIIGLFGSSAYGFEDYSHINSDVKICGDHICQNGEYKILQSNLNNAQRGSNISFSKLTKPIFEYGPPNQSTIGNPRPNFIMDIHIPNHVDYYGVVLSYDDFQTLKNNVAIMAVTYISTTTLSPNMNYCNLAETIWEGQDQSFQAKYPKNLVVPPICNQTPIPVPEFPMSTGLIITCVLITTGIVICAKSELNKKK